MNNPMEKLTMGPAITTEEECSTLSAHEKKVMSNPYAYMLASPVRKCIHSDRMMPCALLIRFVRAYDDKSNKVWIVPDNMVPRRMKKRPTKASWVRAEARVIDDMKNSKRYKMIDSSAFWREDMTEHLGILLRMAILDEVAMLQPSDFGTQVTEIQCYITFDEGKEFSKYIEQKDDDFIPSYRIHTSTGFSEEQIEQFKNKMGSNVSLNATMKTRYLAAALWKLRQYRGEHVFNKVVFTG